MNGKPMHFTSRGNNKTVTPCLRVNDKHAIYLICFVVPKENPPLWPWQAAQNVLQKVC